MGFARLTARLQELECIKGKIVLVLEGGYNLAAISKCCAACAKVLIGDKNMLKRVQKKAGVAMGGDPMPGKVYSQTVQRVREVHSKYWASMRE
jgi:histone deacetylase 6